MRQGDFVRGMVTALLCGVMAVPPLMFAQVTAPTAPASTQPDDTPPLTQAELDQVVAPVALYPDSLLSQILMAASYPLEVVQANRWVKDNKNLTGDALAAALEKQPWDPSVKSLVNFPQVLEMMDSKLDWTVKLGDAFIEQQKQVMDTVQSLRAQAQSQGNLQTNEQQKVIVQPATVTEPQVIVIEPANPQVIYVPTYNPTVVYGVWAYPAYPPYYYYPPGYVAGAAAVSFGVGLALGMAWGYAWGGCNWRGGNVNINVNRNININNTHINRNNYARQYNRTGNNMQNGQGNWRHDSSHREGVSYRDRKTADQYGRGQPDRAQRARDDFRGRQDSPRPSQGAGQNRPSQGQNRPGGDRPTASQRPAQRDSGTRSGALDDAGRGRDSKSYSDRGKSSRGSGGGGQRSSGGARGGGGGRGGGRR